MIEKPNRTVRRLIYLLGVAILILCVYGVYRGLLAHQVAVATEANRSHRTSWMSQRVSDRQRPMPISRILASCRALKIQSARNCRWLIR